MNEIRYSYKPKPVMAILCILFFGVFAFFMAHFSSKNDRGLILNGIIEFSTTGATTTYWIITALFTAMSVLGVVLLFRSITSKNELILTENFIQAPKSGISNKIIAIQFKDIKKVTIQKVQKNQFLNILHEGGKLTIVSSLLPSREDFEHVKNYVANRAIY